MESEKDIEQCSESQILCEICNGIFKTKRSLQQHIQSVHMKLRHSCNQCGHQCIQLGDLKRHIQSVHEKIKYPCNLCEYQASSQGHLKRHILSVHEKIRRSKDSITK